VRISRAWLFLLGVPLLHASSSPGLKMTIRHSDGISSDQTLYVEQDRRRQEYRNAVGGAKRWYGSTDVRYGPRLASITRCDLGQSFELNLDTGEYMAGPYPPKPLSKEQRESLGLKLQQPIATGKSTLRIETTTVDTGERKDFFGHTARHIITTEKQIPLEGSSSQAQQTVKDGWYIDLDTSISCDWWRIPPGKRVYTHAFLTAGNMPIEKREFVDHGQPETGFPIELKMSSTAAIALPNGAKREDTTVTEMRVTLFVEDPLDPALFTIPTGFRQVDHIERNPPATGPNRWSTAWDQFKATVARVFH